MINHAVFTTSNYIVPSFIIFLVFLAIFLSPLSLSTRGSSTGCSVGDAPNGNELLLPAIGPYGSPDFSKKSTFVLIRQNVATPDHLDFFKAPNHTDHDDSHLESFGEFPEKPGFEVFYPVNQGGGEVRIEIDAGGIINLFLNQEGLVFFRNKNPATIKRQKSKVTGQETTMYSVDVYQDKQALNNPAKSYKTEDLFKCNGDLQFDTEGSDSVLIPQQNKSPNNEQLQLEWFVFQKHNYWAIHCKPAIYLYPPEKTLVNVKVFPAGTLMYTDPQYDSKNGWTVEANPDGALTTTYNLQPTYYPYLYFESKIRDEVIRKPTKGWVVESKFPISNIQYPISNTEWFGPMEEKFNEVLPKLGLNPQQTKDFIEYWKKALPYSPYYFVGVIDQDNVNQIERLEITPKPDSINRVRIYFERLDTFKNVEPPSFDIGNLKFDIGNSFKVVEWGGMVKNDPDHPFTCSQ